MGLKEYHGKRHFDKTPEPRGKQAAKAHRQLAYVIQKHDASHLHYDFRLEHEGVLKSWAVPKGPDLDPANKRLAMQVEDHPLEYGDFEGTIPPGEYGGGTVMVWDRGTWEPVGDAEKGFRDGHLKLVLHGEKLRGRWMLIRKGGQHAEEGERHWFLFKERDEFARPGESITEEMPLSVATGRDLDQIAAESDRVWGPEGEVRQGDRKTTGKSATATETSNRRRTNKRAPNGRAKKGRTTVKRAARPDAEEDGGAGREALRELLKRPGVRRGALRKSQSVELATLVDAAPNSDQWLHEIKFDGYRMLCRVANGKARFVSRKHQDWTARFPELARAAGGLAVKQAMLDGEVVSLRPDGTTSFQALQNVFQTARTGELVYYVFDILHLDGYDLTQLPLETRREILKLVLAGVPDSIRFSDSIQGSGREVIDRACRLHLEGIVSKRRTSTYQPGRGLDWLKVKCSQRAEFVIGGYTEPSGHRLHFGALLLGHYDRGKKLIYAGRVGTGFSQEMLAAVHQKLKRIEQSQSPFANLSGTTGQARDVTWVKPDLVGEIEFSNWTDEGILRHASFLGLREDNPASAVIHDEPLSLSEAQAMASGEKAAGREGNGRGGSEREPVRSRSVAPKAGANGDYAGVRLTHPDKVLYSGQGITKEDLAAYYLKVADWMLPHVIDRPLAIVRCPEGSKKPCFFQKHPGDDVAWKHLRKIDVSLDGEPEFNLAIHDLAGLISLVQMGVLEIHVWGSRAGKLEKPDRLVFDLDPDPAVEWQYVIDAARQLRALLEELGLESFLKTTGGKGLHLVVPVQARTAWDEAKAFCRAVAETMVRAAPDRYIATMSKAARKGKIFIDYLRNGRGATAVAPYSTRAKPGATVSTPIAWDELAPSLRSDHFTIANLPARLSQLKKDPWDEITKGKQSITAAMVKRVTA